MRNWFRFQQTSDPSKYSKTAFKHPAFWFKRKSRFHGHVTKRIINHFFFVVLFSKFGKSAREFLYKSVQLKSKKKYLTVNGMAAWFLPSIFMIVLLTAHWAHVYRFCQTRLGMMWYISMLTFQLNDENVLVNNIHMMSLWYGCFGPTKIHSWIDWIAHRLKCAVRC